jgi:hypothetical protein
MSGTLIMSRVVVPSNSLSGSGSPPSTGLNLGGGRSSTLEMLLPTPLLLYTATAVEGWFLKMPSRWVARTSPCSISAANDTV